MLTNIENATILKKNGQRVGPYKAKFAGKTVIIADKMADIDDGDTVIRTLPNGKEEMKEIYTSIFYDKSATGLGPHFQLSVGPQKQAEPHSQTINVNGNNVQIGNNNNQNISTTINALNDIIEKSSGSETEKAEAKGLLRKFATHPLVCAIAGGAISSLL